MSHKAKPGGYIDRAALSRAGTGVDEMAADVRTLIDEGTEMSTMRRLQVLGRMATRLPDYRDALAKMEAIRAGTL